MAAQRRRVRRRRGGTAAKHDLLCKHNSITMDTNVNFLRGCFPNTAESKIKEILNAENISGNVDLAVSELLNHSVKKSIKNFQEPFLTKLQKEGQGREGVEKLLNQAHSPYNSKMIGDKSDMSVERQCLSLKVDEDIMAVVMSDCLSLPLQAKLNQLQTEIEWNRGSSTATAWRRSYSSCFPVWAEQCKRVVAKFLGRYEKTVVKTPVGRAITREMPRLEQKIPGGKLLTTLHGNKRVLLLICLKPDTVPMLTLLKDSIEAIEKDEIRTSKESLKVDDVCYEHLVLLKQVGFDKEIVVKYPELKLTLDLKKKVLCLNGPSSCVVDADLKYKRTMSQVMEGLVSLPSSLTGCFITKPAVQRYIWKKLKKKNVFAVFFLEKDEVVKIVAVDSLQYYRAKDCLIQAVRKVKLLLMPDNRSALESEKWKQIFDKMKGQELLEICVDEWSRSVVLYGILKVVQSAKEEIAGFLDGEIIHKTCRKVSKSMARFLKKHMSDKIKDIEKQLKDSSVGIKIDQVSGILHIKGKRGGVQPCVELLSTLCSTVASKKVEFSSPGISRLISGTTFRQVLEMMEKGKKLLVTSTIRPGQDTKDAEEIKVWPDQKPGQLQVFTEATVLKSSDSTEVKCANEFQDSCAKKGIKLSFKYGDIANEKADILVSSATSNLTAPSACGLALNRVGGPSFINACKPHTNIKAGTMVCTAGGNLACRQVLHVVCCKWDGRHGMAEKLLRDLIHQIICKCVELGASSVAMPLIGSGNLKFPRSAVFQAMNQALEKSGKRPLNEIRIIIYDPSQGPTKAITSQPVPVSPQTGSEWMVNPPCMWSCGLVDVSLVHGDITRYPANGIVNTLPSDLKLSNGVDSSKRILEAGGNVIQVELDSSSNNAIESVIRTSAGSMTNTRFLLHFVPSSSDSSGLQRFIEKCLNIAKSQSLNSIAIPVLQSSLVPVSCKRSAELMINAVKSFSTSRYPLKVIIFVPGKEMIEYFQNALRERTRAKDLPVSAETSQNMDRASSEPRRVFKAAIRTLRQSQSKDIVILHLAASSQQDIDVSLEEINKLVKDHTVTKTIDGEETCHVLIKNWTKVESLSRLYDVTITCDAQGEATVKGEVVSVSDCKEKLCQLVNKQVEEERKANQRKFISKNVQWHYVVKGTSVPYDKNVNAVVEEAFMENKTSICFDKQGAGRCEIYFSDMTERTVEKFERSLKVSRILLADTNAGISLPTHWSPQDESRRVQLIKLEVSSSEYCLARKLFEKEGASGKIIKIERIQNPGLYKEYLVKKQTMQGSGNEMQLFHGTRADNIKSINCNNFNRGYAGFHGTSYGEGVYFARSALYSQKYSHRSSNNYRYMYIAKVLVGKYTVGRKGLKAPPSRDDPMHPGLLYDSVVDNFSNPSIYVVFLDHQCYPEYLITFK